MGALGNIGRSYSDRKEKPVQEGGERDDRSDNYEEEVMQSQKSEEAEKKHDRVNISISRKAYEALEKFTKELNEREVTNSRLFTIEEVLDEEMILLFSDEWKKE